MGYSVKIFYRRFYPSAKTLDFLKGMVVIMRMKQSLCNEWLFTKEPFTIDTLKDGEKFEAVMIPHTWNNLDGQDGGLDYHRGTCWYKKELVLRKKLKVNKFILSSRAPIVLLKYM